MLQIKGKVKKKETLKIKVLHESCLLILFPPSPRKGKVNYHKKQQKNDNAL